MNRFKNLSGNGNSDRGEENNRVVITVIGPDRVGIIASVSSILAENNINILDISQTIMQEFFVMVMVADMNNASIDLVALKELLNREGEQLKMRIDLQHEDIFNFMHRI